MIGITGIGAYVPQTRLTIDEIAVGYSSEEKRKIGIKSVLYEPELSATDMAVIASKRAIEDADISPLDIDWIINTQATMPDYLTWQVSGKIQQDIEATNASFFDLYQNCSGMITGIITAKNYLAGDENNNVVLVNTSEKWDATVKSRMIGKLIMGEAGVAVVVQKNSTGNYILGYSQIGHGNLHDVARMLVGTQKPPFNSNEEEDYYYRVVKDEKARKEMLPINIEFFYKVGIKAVENSKLDISDIEHIIFPNAGFGLFEKVMEKFEMPLEKTNYKYVANTGDCGSVDMMLNYFRMLRDNMLKKGEHVLLIAQGAGTTWTALVIEV